MDALSFNPIQSGMPAPSNIALDAPVPDGGSAGIDFSTLLALGLNPNPQEDTTAPRTEEEITANSATSTDAPMPSPVPELLIAMPLQPLGAQAAAGTERTPAPITPVVEQDPVLAEPATATSLAAPPNASQPAAGIADEPANIAATGEQPGRPVRSAVASQGADQRLDIPSDPKEVIASEAAPMSDGDVATRPAPPAHAVQAHPVESRAPIAHPSALLEVHAPVSEPGFAQALSRQVVWMVDKDAQVAELRINPPELGPIEVRLTLTQDSAAAEFVSPHAEVRAAIENAIVRLREAMADAGIQLGEASVSAESFSGRPDTRPQSRSSRDAYREEPFASHGAVQSSGAVRSMGRGLVDVFA